MSLATQGLNLIREGFALAIDCACCIAEQCDNIPCVSSRECQEAGLVPDATCKCLQGQCTSLDCLTDEDCPEGYYCLDGVCVPNCTGEPCTEDFDCNDGCVCAGGQCFPASDMVYCQRDPDDLEADPRCRFGRPSDPSLIVGGPFTSYGICCFVGCDCKYICNPVSYACDPNPDGEYGSPRVHVAIQMTWAGAASPSLTMTRTERQSAMRPDQQMSAHRRESGARAILLSSLLASVRSGHSIHYSTIATSAQ